LMLVPFPITEHFTKTERDSTFYLACGPETGPRIIFVQDYICETIDSDLVEPMRRDRTDLTEAAIPSGAWMTQEQQPIQVNAALTRWLAAKARGAWPAL